MVPALCRGYIPRRRSRLELFVNQSGTLTYSLKNTTNFPALLKTFCVNNFDTYNITYGAMTVPSGFTAVSKTIDSQLRCADTGGGDINHSGSYTRDAGRSVAAGETLTFSVSYTIISSIDDDDYDLNIMYSYSDYDYRDMIIDHFTSSLYTNTDTYWDSWQYLFNYWEFSWQAANLRFLEVTNFTITGPNSGSTTFTAGQSNVSANLTILNHNASGSTTISPDLYLTPGDTLFTPPANQTVVHGSSVTFSYTNMTIPSSAGINYYFSYDAVKVARHNTWAVTKATGPITIQSPPTYTSGSTTPAHVYNRQQNVSFSTSGLIPASGYAGFSTATSTSLKLLNGDNSLTIPKTVAGYDSNVGGLVSFALPSTTIPDISGGGALPAGTYAASILMSGTDTNGAPYTNLSVPMGDVVVENDTTPPTVDVGADVVTNHTITKTATATDTAVPMTYAWSKVSGSGTVTFGSSTSLTSTISASTDDTYVIRLSATDAAGNTGHDDFSMTWDTAAPNVNAGLDQIKRTSFTQTGTAPGASTYAWSTVSGPTGGVVTYGSASALSTTISASVDGTYVIRLTGTDLAGNAGTDDFTLIWDTTPPNITYPAANQNFGLEPSQFTVTSVVIGESFTPTYLWEQSGDSDPAGGTITFGTSTAAATTISADQNGTYHVKLTVTDAAGNSSTVTIVFVWGGEKPTVTEVTRVGSTKVYDGWGYTSDNTPDVVIESDQTGTLSYGGSCASLTTTITLNTPTTLTLKGSGSATLVDATYSSCTVTVTSAGQSTTLSFSTFVVDTTRPTFTLRPNAHDYATLPVTLDLIGQDGGVLDNELVNLSSSDLTVTDGVTWSLVNPVAGLHGYQISISAAPNNATITVSLPVGVATDRAGNTNLSGSGTLSYYPAPTLTAITSPASGAQSTAAKVITFTETNGNSPLCGISEIGAGSEISCSGSGNKTLNDIVGFSSLTDGTYTLYVRDAQGGGFGGTTQLTQSFIKDTTAPSFTIQYYSDPSLLSGTSLGNNPYLKAGTYYLKITASESLTTAPTISINAEGALNDVTTASTDLFSGTSYIYTRTIVTDTSAVGTTKEAITITGTDKALPGGNTATNVIPTNASTTEAYTDTTLPTVDAGP
ncbi:MAG: Ig-like domain repeat protein, partial [Candidatus Berkelbacteria bacterium]|nr:Ig-like domain repeat protein [Candidatus Berkelbacteria bacterium]